MKIPYQLVSMAAMLRDFFALNSDDYLNEEHQMLTDIADYLYNSADGAFSDHPEDKLLPEFKVIFDNYGADYFKQVTDDMYAIDSQVTSTAKEDELYEDYQDRLKSGVTASTRLTATTNYDTKLIAKWLKAKFDDEAFGTAYTMHRISDADAYMGRNKLTYNRKNNTIELIGNTPEEDTPIYKVIPQYSSTKKQGTYAPKLPKLIPIDDWNTIHNIVGSRMIKTSSNPFYDKLSESSKRFVRNTEKKMATMFSPDNFDVYNAILPYIGDYESNTGWSGSCELMRVKDSTTADGYTYKVIWDGGHDIDLISWHINDNPRVGGDYTLMVMPSHGMPDFCDSENDFYRAIRKVFGNGLRKV